MCGSEIRRHDLWPAIGVAVDCLWICALSTRRERAVAVGQLICVRDAKLVLFIEKVIEAAVNLLSAGVRATEWRALDGVAAAERMADPPVACSVQTIAVHNGRENGCRVFIVVW